MRLRLFITVITLVLMPVTFAGCYGWTSTIYGIWGSSASDVFAVVEDGAILHYNGSRWSDMNSDTDICLRSVWGRSASDVFAVGDGGTIMHYDGINWSEMRRAL